MLNNFNRLYFKKNYYIKITYKFNIDFLLFQQFYLKILSLQLQLYNYNYNNNIFYLIFRLLRDFDYFFSYLFFLGSRLGLVLFQRDFLLGLV